MLSQKIVIVVIALGIVLVIISAISSLPQGPEVSIVVATLTPTTTSTPTVTRTSTLTIIPTITPIPPTTEGISIYVSSDYRIDVINSVPSGAVWKPIPHFATGNWVELFTVAIWENTRFMLRSSNPGSLCFLYIDKYKNGQLQPGNVELLGTTVGHPEFTISPNQYVKINTLGHNIYIDMSSSDGCYQDYWIQP